jgi:anti-sigma factor RsiW
MNPISFRDIEQLSAYLDDGLSFAERARLEARLETDPQLASALQALAQSRAALRQLPQRRVPRNFILTPKLAGVRPPLPRSYPIFRFASTLAALMFFFASVLNFAAPRVSMLAASAPAPYGYGGGADVVLEQSALATEAPVEKSAAPSSAEITATPEAEMLAAPTATPEMLAQDAPTVEAPPPNERAMGGGADNTAPVPIAPPPLIPFGWLWGLVGVAVSAGAVAYFIRWRADRQFDQAKRK